MTPQQFKSIREAAKQTQAELALALNVSRKTIMRYEAGESPIPKAIYLAMRNVKKLAAPKLLARNEGQITPQRFGELYRWLGKSRICGMYHPISLFPDLPWPRDAHGQIPLDACPAAVLFTPQYAAAAQAADDEQVRQWGPNSRVLPPVFELEPAENISDVALCHTQNT